MAIISVGRSFLTIAIASIRFHVVVFAFGSMRVPYDIADFAYNPKYANFRVVASRGAWRHNDRAGAISLSAGRKRQPIDGRYHLPDFRRAVLH